MKRAEADGGRLEEVRKGVRLRPVIGAGNQVDSWREENE